MTSLTVVPQDVDPDEFDVIESDAFSVRFMLTSEGTPVIGIAFRRTWPGAKPLARLFTVDDACTLARALSQSLTAAEAHLKRAQQP